MHTLPVPLEPPAAIIGTYVDLEKEGYPLLPSSAASRLPSAPLAPVRTFACRRCSSLHTTTASRPIISISA